MESQDDRQQGSPEPAAGSPAAIATQGSPVPAPTGKEAVISEELQAQRLAERLGIEFVDLKDFQIDHDLFRSIPVDLMFRYNFIPRRKEGGSLKVVIDDPSDVLKIDELEVLLKNDLAVRHDG